MILPDAILHVGEAWSSVYGNHPWLSSSVIFMHLAGLVGAGGPALLADRLIWRATTDAERVSALAQLPDVHRLVLQSLTVVIVSGMLMMLADLEVFLTSRVFYLKLGALALLAINGWALRRAQRLARGSDPSGGWRRVRLTATFSGVLWLATLFLGVLLTKTA